MNAVKQFNGLNGAVANRKELQQIILLADEQEQIFISKRLSKLLRDNPDEKNFKISLKETAIDIAPDSSLHCFDCEENNDEELEGLGRVSPVDIYKMITDKMISAIKEASGKDYQKKWKDGYITGRDGKPLEGYLVPHNFVTKKPYRGINLWLLSNLIGLQVMPLENPFYMTFKQIESLGGTLKKGSKGKEVVYFTMLYKIKTKNLDFATYDKEKFIEYLAKNGYSKSEILNEIQKSKIPILRYYNVFNGADVEGIDFKLNDFKSGYVIPEKKDSHQERINLAELIVKNYPNPKPEYKEGNSDRAYYSSAQDLVRMPHFDSFETSQDYYRTLFHEYIHSTGNELRLNRDFSGRFGSKPYAKEELVAEFGAIFLSAQAGIIWHSNKNHSEYLKNWHNVLGIIEEDSRFLMRAASDAQRASDYILQPDQDGNPLFIKEISKSSKEKEKKKTTEVQLNKNLIGYMLVDDISADIVATKKTLEELEKVYYGLEKSEIGKKSNPLVFEIVQKNGKNVKGKKVDVTWKVQSNNETPKTVEKKTVSVSESNKKTQKNDITQKAVKDVLTLKKFHFEEQPVSEILYKYYSDKNFEKEANFTKKELEIIESDYTNFFDHELSPTDLAKDFVIAVSGRIESLSNQKHNYTLFEGLAKPRKEKGLNNKRTLEQLKKLGFQSASEPIKDAPDTFVLPGEIGLFLQTQQSYKSLILIKGPKHSSKTQLAMQIANAFGERGEVVAYIDYEQGGLQSKDTQNSIKWNTTEKGLKNIMIKGYLENPLEELKEFCKHCKIIIADSVTDLKITADELNDLRCNHPEVHWIFISQVKENGEMYGGNKMAHNPTGVIECHPAINPNERYATLIKNRGNDLSLKYNIFSKKLIKEPKLKKVKSKKDE